MEKKLQDEAESADAEAQANYPEDLTEIINEGGYTKQHIANVQKIAFSWRKMISRTLIAREEKSIPGFKASEEIETSIHLPF